MAVTDQVTAVMSSAKLKLENQGKKYVVAHLLHYFFGYICRVNILLCGDKHFIKSEALEMTCDFWVLF